MTEAQRDLLTRRWRKIKSLSPSEFQIQAAIVDYVRLMARVPTLCFAVPNGELRDKRTAAKLKASGVMPGVSDLILIRQAPWSCDRQPQVLCLEVKTRIGKLSEAQEKFRGLVGLFGCEYTVAHSFDDGISFLEKTGWTRPRQAAGAT